MAEAIYDVPYMAHQWPAINTQPLSPRRSPGKAAASTPVEKTDCPGGKTPARPMAECGLGDSPRLECHTCRDDGSQRHLSARQTDWPTGENGQRGLNRDLNSPHRGAAACTWQAGKRGRGYGLRRMQAHGGG